MANKVRGRLVLDKCLELDGLNFVCWFRVDFVWISLEFVRMYQALNVQTLCQSRSTPSTKRSEARYDTVFVKPGILFA